MAPSNTSELSPVTSPNEQTASSPSTDNQAQLSSRSTLLPSPIANVVSLVTRSSSLTLRLGTSIGSLALDGARITTLTGLELSRAVIEGILTRAGRDVAGRSNGDLGRAEAEGLLERSIASLHATITSISFVASTGFYFSSATLAGAADISQQLLSTLDSILGSTESSRAIASIITLIRREFENPATGVQGEKVGVVDLLLGICGLALLQRWSKKLTDAEAKERRYEQVVWDVVVLDASRRADVVGPIRPLVEARDSSNQGMTNESRMLAAPSGNEIVDTVDRGIRNQEEPEDDDMLEVDIKRTIMRTLPPEASVSITTSITTTKTITVDITGTEPPDLSPPPGVEVVEESAHHAGANGGGESAGLAGSRYRVVYRILRDKIRGTTIKAEKDAQNVHEIEDDSDNSSEHSESLSLEDLRATKSIKSRNLPSGEREFLHCLRDPPVLPLSFSWKVISWIKMSHHNRLRNLIYEHTKKKPGPDNLHKIPLASHMSQRTRRDPGCLPVPPRL